ncbi:hypothetical protein Vretimale_16402 [Volvox reticuliferus]|uniref:Uncharacterized protein n=1 Tax=Volvox reticuliferus TaxID=1737510 RepID=A0A8J4GSL2_9CHLO|nr:hypothetical protein Vretimale_16402 [Volvox reticuliferus]
MNGQNARHGPNGASLCPVVMNLRFTAPVYCIAFWHFVFILTRMARPRWMAPHIYTNTALRGFQWALGHMLLQMTQLRAVLRQAVGWQFDGIQVLGEDDDDEYAPVVVELGPEDMEMTPLADEGVPGVQDMANIRPTQSAGDGITAYTA